MLWLAESDYGERDENIPGLYIVAPLEQTSVYLKLR
jgi:hypothetical protein